MMTGPVVADRADTHRFSTGRLVRAVAIVLVAVVIWLAPRPAGVDGRRTTL